MFDERFTYSELDSSDKMKLKNMLLNGAKRMDILFDIPIRGEELKSLKEFFQRERTAEILAKVDSSINRKNRRFSKERKVWL
jgi:hypothetical protein